MQFYILNPDKRLIETNLDKHAAFVSDPKNIVIEKAIFGEIEISTSFIGIQDIIFETLAVEGKRVISQKRYKNYLDAVRGHEATYLEIHNETIQRIRNS